jgi:nicotinate-nucleotide pyrophosphorylase (carboxylating)
VSTGLPVLPPAAAIDADVARALEEDIGAGDVTAALLPDRPARARVITREAARIAGGAWFERCFRALDPDVRIAWDHHDGSDAAPGARLCTIEGRSRALVSAERTALNFLQTLSGTATTTAHHVAAIAGTQARLLDTRKTLPGLRLAQKYAVRVGGGMNHRIGLFDAYLIKENHIAAAGSIAAAVADARARGPALLLEVEVESLAELEQALEARVDRVLLDEFSLDQMREAVRICAKRSTLEVSGGVSLETIRAIAETGVDFISVGALTKHVRAIDLSMRVL